MTKPDAFNHPAIKSLRELAAGRLSNAEAHKVNVHLAACESCSKIATSFSLPEEILAETDIHGPYFQKDDVAETLATKPSEGAEVPRSQEQAKPVFGDYELLSEIARGGMGVVYRARQTKLDRVVALKMILAGQFADEAAIERFYSEAASAARLDHPGIVPIYEVGEQEGQHFYSMAFVEGKSLAALVAENPLLPEVAATITRDIANAMAYAHSQGVIHRDLKPANVLIDKDESPRVTDFGLAKNLGKDSGLTQTGSIIGTPSYMPPEQALGSEVGPLADVYSLGALLYCLLTSRPPFQGATITDTLLLVINDEPVAPRLLNPKLPADLETICLKCLAKEPSKRYVSAQALADDLQRQQRGEPIEARPAGLTEHIVRWCCRNPVIAATTGTALSLLVAIALLATISYFREADLRVQSEHARETADQLRAQETVLREDAEASAIAAEQARAKEALARTEADKQREEAKRQQHMATVNLAESYADRGRTLCLQGEVEHGLLWMARGLRILPPGELAVEGLIRRRIGAWETRIHQRQMVTPHSKRLYSARYCPNGDWFITAASDGEARIWDSQSGTPLSPPLKHQGNVRVAAVDPRGTFAVTADDKAMRFWKVPNGELMGTMPLPVSVWGMRLLPDGKTVVTRGWDGKLRFWDIESQQQVGSPISLGAARGAIGVSPDGAYVAVTAGNTLKVFDAETRTALRNSISIGSFDEIRVVTFSPNGASIAVGGYEGDAKHGVVRFWDFPSCEQQPDFIKLEPGAVITDLAYAKNGDTFVTASLNQTAQLWSSKTKTPIGLALHSDGPIRSVAIHPDGKVLTAGDDGAASTWSLSKDHDELRLFALGDAIYGVAIANNNQRIIAGSRNGTGRLWNAITGETIGEPIRHNSLILYVAISPDSNLAATGSLDRSVKIWKTSSGEAVGKPIRLPCQVLGLAFGHDNRTLLIGGDDGSARLWDLEKRKELLQTKSPHRVFGVEFDSTGKRFAVGCGHDTFPHSGELSVWDATTGERLFGPFRQEDVVFNSSFSPNDAAIWVTVRHAALQLDLHTGQKIGPSLQHPGIVWDINVHPRGDILATSCEDGGVRFWDISTMRSFGPVFRHDNVAISVVFSKDGEAVVTGGFDGVSRLWRTPVASQGSAEMIERRIQLSTGLQLEELGELRPLTTAAWLQLDRLGTP